MSGAGEAGGAGDAGDSREAGPGGGARIEVTARPRVERRFRLQWEPAQSAHVLLYPEGMIKLNGSAGEIMKRCDGQATIEQITADLERTFNTIGLSADVLAFIGMAVQKQWLVITP